MALIRQSLSEPAKVRAMVARLKPFERNVLAVLRQLGNEADVELLVFTLRALGVPLPEVKESHYNVNYKLIEPLVNQGLLFVAGSSNSLSLSNSRQNTVFSDERLLAEVSLSDYDELPLIAHEAFRASTYRHPPAVTLELIGFLQAIEDIKGLKLTQKNSVRVDNLRKLSRTMGWEYKQIEIDGLIFPSPAEALVTALRQVAMLILEGESLYLAESPHEFAQHSYIEQIALLMNGFIENLDWFELESRSFYSYQENVVRGRRMLITLLGTLPPPSAGFLSFERLEKRLFERIGEEFCLHYLPRRPYPYPYDRGKKGKQTQKDKEEWRRILRTSWVEREKPWLKAVFSSWLYFLGVVELALDGETLAAIRLTELGYAVLHPEEKKSFETPSTEGQPAWIVQPNFDVVAFLNQASPTQLAFLERHAERVKIQQHTAQYRITRQAVYQGLESGTKLEELLALLDEGTAHPLPQNVLIEIREWAALRESMVLHRQGYLIEFALPEARQAALQDKQVVGTPLGERFLLVKPPNIPFITSRIDYQRPLPRSLHVTAKGVLTLTEASDLFIEAELDKWAKRQADGKWLLTEETVSAAVRSDLPVETLFKLLADRLTHSLPPLLKVAIESWTGDPHSVMMQNVTVLRCEQAVFKAITSTDTFKPYLLGRLAPDALVVQSDKVEELRNLLGWMGLTMNETLEVKELRW
jgi:hypothetical protein